MSAWPQVLILVCQPVLVLLNAVMLWRLIPGLRHVQILAQMVTLSRQEMLESRAYLKKLKKLLRGQGEYCDVKLPYLRIQPFGSYLPRAKFFERRGDDLIPIKLGHELPQTSEGFVLCELVERGDKRVDRRLEPRDKPIIRLFILHRDTLAQLVPSLDVNIELQQEPIRPAPARSRPGTRTRYTGSHKLPDGGVREFVWELETDPIDMS